MNLPKIVFKIDDRVYRLDASDGPAIRKIPKEDRQHLLTLLLAVKKQEQQLESEQAAQNKDSHEETKADAPVLASQLSAQGINDQQPARLSADVQTQDNPENKEDIDRLFERLVEEERAGRIRLTKLQWYVILTVVSSLLLSLISFFK